MRCRAICNAFWRQGRVRPGCPYTSAGVYQPAAASGGGEKAKKNGNQDGGGVEWAASGGRKMPKQSGNQDGDGLDWPRRQMETGESCDGIPRGNQPIESDLFSFSGRSVGFDGRPVWGRFLEKQGTGRRGRAEPFST